MVGDASCVKGAQSIFCHHNTTKDIGVYEIQF